jgi:hypothetical protein
MALTINPDTVCYLILKARAFEAKVAPAVADGGSNPADDDERAVLFNAEQDPIAEELRGGLLGLNVEERAEVLALVWLGRGDYVAEQWSDAVSEARAHEDRGRIDALIGIPLLAEYLEDGLSQLGYSCADVERDHL